MQRPEALPASEVIKLLRIKVARNPGDFDASLMLGSALYNAGDLPGSASAFKTALSLRPGHSQTLLLLARTEARSGHIAEALEVLAHAQHVDPANSQVWQVAAALASDARDWSELQRIGSGWTKAHPTSLEAWQTLSRAYFEESQFSEAISAYAKVLDLQPGNPNYLIGAARLEIAAQRYQHARHYLNSAQKITPDSPELLYTLCRLHHMTGELDAAEGYCRRAITARPGFATAYVELGTLREGRLDDTEIQVIDKMFRDTAVHPEYRVMLGFTLGDALDRKGDLEQAFNAWDEANNINRKISEQEGFVYQPELVESEPELLAGIFAESVELNLGPLPTDSPRPIFVVGMPRSGTTLIESILASHSEVYGAGELPTLYDIHEELMHVSRNQGIEAAREMVRKESANWRERYLTALPAIDEETSVVDKQPLNYRSVGLIRLLFPESPIIYAQRSALDTGLSIYRHKFSKSWPCAHSLGDIGHYYGVHARIVDMWRRRYPQAVLVVDHADLVRDPQTEIARLLSFAGLPSEAACYRPHQTKRPIATFSSVQVRQPLSAAFIGRAQRYAEQLAPLRDALNNAGIGVSDTCAT